MSPSLNRTAVQCVGRLLKLSCTLCTLLGCDASPVESLPPAARTLDAISSTWQRRKVDILFVIDNTRSMVAKQRALAETFGSQQQQKYFPSLMMLSVGHFWGGRRWDSVPIGRRV